MEFVLDNYILLEGINIKKGSHAKDTLGSDFKTMGFWFFQDPNDILVAA
jgi:hypothetical protein